MVMRVGGPLFDDRRDAGRQLGERLAGHAGDEVIVLGLARGGVPVAREVARALDAFLDVLVVRKIGAPGQPELAVGALAPGATFLNEPLLRSVGLSGMQLQAVIEEKKAELAERSRDLRGGRPEPDLRGKTVILVDDGVATGATMFASIDAARARGAGRIVVAVPVCAADTLAQLRGRADEVVTLYAPEYFFAVGAWYREFDQTSSGEVRSLLAEARTNASGSAARGDS